MEALEIYRIQHKVQKLGIWNAVDENKNDLVDKHSQLNQICDIHWKDEFPDYKTDRELYEQITYNDLQSYKFAYLTLERFQSSLTNTQIQEFATLGFQVVKLTVTDYYKSRYQVVFHPDSITKEEDITHLFL